MHIPLEDIWPGGYRWLQIMHMEHLLDMTTLRIMLLLGCAISLLFGITWIVDFLELRCFQHSPWTEDGIGQYTCLVKIVGGVMMILMFKHSVVALAYYDEDGDRMRAKKERYLDEMQRQIGDVLLRATGQAKKLCGMLSAQLDEKVSEHVRRMQRILGECEKIQSSKTPEVYNKLAEQMALHLHQLRKPAIEHFQKLIALSGRAQFLEETLQEQRHTSMVELLTIHSQRNRLDLPRTETVIEDPEIGLLAQGIHAARQAHSCCSCWHARQTARSKAQRCESLDRNIYLPSEGDLHQELRQPTIDEMKKAPELVVLRPVKLVLTWFEKIEPARDGRSSRSPAIQGAIHGLQELNPSDKLHMVYIHLKDSPLYRSLLVGIIFSIIIFTFHLHLAGVVFHLMREGRGCSGITGVACFGELCRTILVMCGMVCYAASLMVVLWNVDRLDSVLQVSEELHELQDFKHQLDHLNAHDLADEDSDISMLQIVEKSLASQKRIVAEFYNNAWGESLQDISTFSQLAIDLEKELHTNDRSARSAGEYNRLPASERSPQGASLAANG